MSWAELRTKKSIKQSHRDRMADNEFNEFFSFVEIDDSYDLDNFTDAEIDFNDLVTKLNLHKSNFQRTFTFRVRKIKARTVSGRYYPTHRTLIADVKEMGAFVHELGHLLDYEWHGGDRKLQLSKQDNFKPVIKAYAEHYNATAEHKRNSGYYLNDGEIFARSFELYVLDTVGAIVINEDPSYYERSYNKKIYPTNDKFKNVMHEYFNNLFKVESVKEVVAV